MHKVILAIKARWCRLKNGGHNYSETARVITQDTFGGKLGQKNTFITHTCARCGHQRVEERLGWW